MNPTDSEGNPLRCRACDSIRYLVKDCPHSWENMESRKSVMEVKDEEEAHFLKNYSEEEKEILMCEAANSAVLDSECTSTVAGRPWMDTYLASLSAEERTRVKHLPGETKLRSCEKLVLLS